MSVHRIKILLRRFLQGTRNREIEPDEIFLDSHNLPEFDRNQFEGRIEKPIGRRMQVLVVGVTVLIFLLYAGRIGYLQVYKGEVFAYLSENNRLQHSILFAERGVLYDRNGTELAWNESESSETSASQDEVFSLRRYTNLRGLAHVIGYVGYPLKDSSGIYYQEEFTAKDGAELFFNDRIKGENGLEIEEVDALQKIQSKNTIRPPEDGENVTLSVDAELSNALYTLLGERVRESGFVGGAGVLMDVTNGEIIALASFPEFNPQVLTDGVPRSEIQSYVYDERKPFLNRIVSGLYTPGSIVKPFVAIGALTEGVITPEKEILSTGSIRLPHPYIEGVYSTFVDWKAHGYVDVRKALAHSSNVYFYEVGGGFESQQGIGIEGINIYARMFGFGEETHSPFAEGIGEVPNPAWKAEHFDGDEWRIGDTYNTAIGQYGFQVTPIQIVRAIGAIANGGVLLSPVLEKGGEAIREKLPVDDSALQVVREGMRLGVQEGSAQALNTGYVRVAAKTGTAQLGVSKKFVNSWVTGFFPYDNPRYAFAIIMEKGPEANLVGGSAVMRGYIEWLYTYAPEYLNPVN
ncbi:MAG: penicillin-binding transpeptidase domain-containing protein [Candidatus Paceibacterota bacterium]